MLDTEVLIVGGGPAGSTLARALTREGVPVVVMDKAVFPRDKVCAGWVTPAVLAELEIDPRDYARGRVLQAINAFRTARIGQPPVHSEFPGGPASYAIRRVEFDDYLLRRCGAKLLLGQALVSMRRERGRWVANDAVSARLLVGAGGHFCPVARALRPGGARETAVAAQELEFEMSPAQQRDCPVDAGVPELFFTADLKGYGWVVRKGHYLNVGLGREDRHRLAGHVERFRDHLARAGRIPADLPGRFRGHAYLLYPRSRRPPAGDAVLLVGDAAGLAYARSGEGIRPAVESALLASRVILDCAGDYSAPRLQVYAGELQKRFGRRRPPLFAPTGRLQHVSLALAGKLMKNRWFSKHILLSRWFLHDRDKPLSAGH